MPGKAEPQPSGGRERYILEGFGAGIISEASMSRTNIPDTACLCANNVEFWPVGTITKRPGKTYRNTGTQLSGSVIGVYQWWSNAGSNYVMVFTAASGTVSGSVAYMSPSSLTTATWTNITSGGALNWNPESNDTITTETFGGSAFFCNGIKPILTWNTTECCAVTTAPTGAVCIRSYKNYLFVANYEDATGRHYSRIRWSDPGDGHTWPDANYMDLDGDDGDYISGMEILGNELIVFKERKILAVTYVGGQYTFYAEGRQSGVGCAAQGSIVPIFSELCFYGIENFYSFTGRDVESLGDNIKDVLINSIIPTYRDGIRGTMFEEKNQIWWAVPITSTTASGNTDILVLDYEQNGWTAHSGELASFTWYSQTLDQTFGSLGLSYATYDYEWGTRQFLGNASLILAGTYNGFIVDNGTAGATTDLGVAYTGLWRSRWVDFNHPDINKRVVRMTLFVDSEVHAEEDDYNLTVEVYTDWDETTPDSTHTISLYGTTPIIERRIDFTTTCRAMQLVLKTTGSGEGFTVHRIVIEYIPKGRTQV